MKGDSHKKKIKYLDFLKNGSNEFNKMLLLYSTFEIRHITLSIFSEKKNP